MFPTSFIEISDSAIKNNIEFIRQMLGDNVIFSSVVKGNAYGHGIQNYCPLAYKHGIRNFSVFSAQEALYLLEAMPHQQFDLMIMGAINNEELPWAIENGIEVCVSEYDRLRAVIRTAKAIKKTAKIHIEFETGMNRTGFDLKEIDSIIHLIKENETHIKVIGICTHLAGAESITNYKRIMDQRQQFRKVKKKLQQTDWINLKWHMASSAAAIRYPETRMDLARIGILQYGFFPTQEILVHYLGKQKNIENTLRRVISWKTRVMDVKMAKTGSFIGYGTSYLTNRASKIALLPVGYANGYSRSLSNQGKVLIKGTRVDVVGVVNMSMLAVDVTNVDGVEKGDEVVLIGKQGDGEISVASFGDFSQLINYELLTRLPQDIPRIIIK